ncbi:MAG: inositol monophosphatase [Clostridia bacterium]|nr:inositol monophosphatase [Clostridia bacterium]
MEKVITGMIRRAARLMLEFADPAVYSKGRHADFVTEADVAVQDYLIGELSRAFPQARFLAEEGEGQQLTDTFTFIIDPIDGTTNYFRRRRCSMISIGAVEGKEPVFGMIYDPYRDELYHAERGKGAWCNAERLHVADMPLEKALIGLGSGPYYEDLFDLTSRSFAALLPKAADIRRTGSACMDLCDVAAGRSDGHFEWQLQPWDYCAATLLVEEAGGRCGNILGGLVTYDRGIPHLAASARIYDELQAILQQVWRAGQP